MRKKLEEIIPTKRLDPKFCPDGAIPVPLKNKTKEIIAFALVDPQDEHILNLGNWCLNTNGRPVKVINGKQTSIGRTVLNINDSNIWVKYKNKDATDCRRANLYTIDKWSGKRNWRNINLKRTYGIDENDYERLLKEQNYCCAICLKSPEEKQKHNGSGKVPANQRLLAVDHCHKTNTVRGLLCYTCNIGLGSFKDDIKLLDKAREYLKIWN